MAKPKKSLKDLGKPKVETPRIPFGVLVRMFLLGGISVVAAVYALWRHHTVQLPPMKVPAPPSATATELPAPELEPSR